MSIERLRCALRLYEENRTTVQSLASSVGDFLREVDTLRQPADSGWVGDDAVGAAVRVFHDAYRRARMGSPRRTGATAAGIRAVLEATLVAPRGVA